MTARRDIKIRHTGRKLIELTLGNPMGGPYPNGDVASVTNISFQKMRTDKITWNARNKMEDLEVDKEARVRDSDGKHLRSGLSEGRSRWLPSQVGDQTYELRGDLHG